MSKNSLPMEAKLIRNNVDCPECGSTAGHRCRENYKELEAIHATRLAQYIVDSSVEKNESEIQIPQLILTSSQLLEIAITEMRKDSDRNRDIENVLNSISLSLGMLGRNLGQKK